MSNIGSIYCHLCLLLCIIDWVVGFIVLSRYSWVWWVLPYDIDEFAGFEWFPQFNHINFIIAIIDSITVNEFTIQDDGRWVCNINSQSLEQFHQHGHLFQDYCFFFILMMKMQSITTIEAVLSSISITPFYASSIPIT